MLDNYYNERQPNVERIFQAPAIMRYAERVMIYALVLGLEPERVLEIGTAHGGTAWIIVQAMDDVGRGELICVDPEPTWTWEINDDIAHRATLVTGKSPGALAECARLAGGPFDLVLIDGDHSTDAVRADVEGVLPYVSGRGRLVFHDWHHPPVWDAIQTSLAWHTNLFDAGRLTVAEIPYLGQSQGGLYSVVKGRD